MTTEQKIDYMIQSLQLAKDEINYAKEYFSGRESDVNYLLWGHKGYNSRNPNGTIIRESLKSVGRMANIVASEVTLSPYSHKLFKESEGS
ncbi:hypothetical protein AALB39_04055 [Lachnospiraceae bacterium 54-53]